MEQKAGGGLQIREMMQQPVNHEENFLKEQAKRDRVQAAAEKRNREFAVELGLTHEKINREFGPKSQKVWGALNWRGKETPVSDSKWGEIRRRSGKPSFGIEMSAAQAEAEAEAEAPIDQGLIGFGILSSIRNSITQLIEQSEKERERTRNLNRPTIF